MKIALISDLHVDSSPDNFKIVDYLIEKLLSLKPDLFIIAGDIAANIQVFNITLKKFSLLSCSKLLVAGNHDIWIDSSSSFLKGIHSGIKYYELLPQICKDNNFIYLGLEPYCIDGIGFAGTIGWYNYTFRNKKYDTLFSIKTYRSKQFRKTITWNDLNFAYWMDDLKGRRKSDEEVALEMETSLKRQIESLKGQGVDRTIVVTHHVPFRKMILYQNRLPWDFFSAFMGSEGLAEIILEESTITHVLCGHSHIKNSLQIGTIKAIKSPLGYSREWRTKNLSELIEEKLTSFDL